MFIIIITSNVLKTQFVTGRDVLELHSARFTHLNDVCRQFKRFYIQRSRDFWVWMKVGESVRQISPGVSDLVKITPLLSWFLINLSSLSKATEIPAGFGAFAFSSLIFLKTSTSLRNTMNSIWSECLVENSLPVKRDFSLYSNPKQGSIKAIYRVDFKFYKSFRGWSGYPLITLISSSKTPII